MKLGRLRGGARRNRTADLVIANDALSQLSYSPETFNGRVLRPRAGLCQLAGGSDKLGFSRTRRFCHGVPACRRLVVRQPVGGSARCLGLPQPD
jgi:hypothetical protein